MSKSENTAKTATDAPKAKFVPKVAKLITMPLLKMAIDVPVYFRIDAPLFIGKAIGDKDAAIIANGVNLETGEQCQLLVPAVMQGILHDYYGAPKYGVPKKGDPTIELEARIEGQEPDAYVGKGFMVIKHAKASGKNYHPHTVAELEL